MDNPNIVFGGILFFITIAIIILAYYSFMRRNVVGSLQLALLCIFSAFYTFGYSMELLSQTLPKIDFWSQIQYIGLPFIPSTWVLLSYAILNVIPKRKTLLYLFLFIFPFLTFIFRVSSSDLHLQYFAINLVSNGHFLVLEITRGVWFYVHYAFFGICIALSFKNYLQYFNGVVGVLKKQAAVLIIASLAPIFSLTLNFFNIFPYKMDSGPFFVFVEFILLTVAIFRFKLLSLIMLSREKVFDWISDSVLVFDRQLNLIDFNITAKQLFTELSERALGQPLKTSLEKYHRFCEKVEEWDLIKNGRVSTGEKDIEKSFSEDEGFEFELTDKTNRTRYYFVKFSILREEKTWVGSAVMISDFTKQHELVKQLEVTSSTDALTGLLNRGSFFELMEAKICGMPNSKTGMALIIMDIDHFKGINDEFGHRAGDKVLKEIADISSKCIRENDLLGRYGGEEFVIFMPETTNENSLKVAERILSTVATTEFVWEGSKMKVSASLGIAFCGLYNKSKCVEDDLMFSNADKALYNAKRNGRNRIETMNI